MDNIDTLRRMYAIVFSGADEALTLLEAGNVNDAKACLMLALGVAEEMYIAGNPAPDESLLRGGGGS